MNYSEFVDVDELYSNYQGTRFDTLKAIEDTFRSLSQTEFDRYMSTSLPAVIAIRGSVSWFSWPAKVSFGPS